MSLSQILKLRSSVLNDLINPEMLAFYKEQRNIGASLSDNILSLQKKLQSLQPAVVSAFEEQKLGYLVKGAALNWGFLDFKPVLNYELIETYTKVFSLLGQPSAFLQQPQFTGLFSEASFDLLSFEIQVENEDKIKQEKARRIIIDESKKIREIIMSIYHKNTFLLELNPRQFEEMIAELLYSQGFKVQITKHTRDGGYDILAVYEMKSQAPQKWLVECKRYKDSLKVDVDIVRSFKEVVQSHNANRGIIATTSYFTRDAIKKREETPYLLDFRDKNDVMQWLIEYAETRLR